MSHLRRERHALKGTYLLILQLEHEIAALRIGRLGQFTFRAGYYIYIGSAYGSGGLPARLAYHERKAKPPHWHVDYLRECSHLLETWAIICDVPLERALVRELSRQPGMSTPVPRFGASDSDQRSHLLFCERRPSPRPLANAILASAESAGSYARQLSIEIHSYDR